MKQLLEHTDLIPGMDIVFMADKDPAVQSWIRAHNNPAYLFGDMSLRLYKPTAVVNKCMKSLESSQKRCREVLVGHHTSRRCGHLHLQFSMHSILCKRYVQGLGR